MRMDEPVNHGFPFRTSDAPGLGLDRPTLYRQLTAGRIRRPLRGVYVDASTPDTRLSRTQALSLVCPPHAVVCMASAAWVLKVDTLPSHLRSSLVAECLVPHHLARPKHPGVRTIEGYVPETDVMELNGIRLTVPNRTAVDLLRRHRRPYALSSADALMRAGLINPAEVAERIVRMRGYPGIVQARALHAMIDGDRESHGESWTFLRLADAGLPWPKAQIVVRNNGGTALYRVDLGYEEQRIGAEYDGREFHNEATVEHDASRRDDLHRTYGWRIQVVTFETVMGDRPDLECQVASWLGLEPELPRLW
jgi:hypothetical protein